LIDLNTLPKVVFFMVPDAATSGRLLLVEDEPLLRAHLARYLGSRGWQVAQAAHGGQAWKRLEDGDARILLTDLHMPLMDGFALIRKIRACPDLARVGIVAMSGRPGPDTAALRREHPDIAFLGKPFGLTALDAALARVQGARISF
jgi:DNA-binding response OmpR family regulator